MPSGISVPPNNPEAKDDIVIEAKPLRQTLAQIRSLIAGGVGGICAVVVGHPFDLVKVRLQTADKGVYTGAIDVVKRAMAREGIVRVCATGFPISAKWG
jgi:solute carrier family 25 (mitochondrial carnitine/acylcarnitine transporter), member 20/29